MKMKDIPNNWVKCENGLWRKPVEYTRRNGKVNKSSYRYHEKKCINCGEIYLADFAEKDSRFCDSKCSKVGKFHPRWKGGRLINRGYIYIWDPGHPHASARNYVAEHIVVATKKIGRLLKKNEHVHHINGIKDDNRPENLIVMTINGHLRLHSRINRLRKKVEERDRLKKENN